MISRVSLGMSSLRTVHGTSSLATHPVSPRALHEVGAGHLLPVSSSSEEKGNAWHMVQRATEGWESMRLRAKGGSTNSQANKLMNDATTRDDLSASIAGSGAKGYGSNARHGFDLQNPHCGVFQSRGQSI